MKNQFQSILKKKRRFYANSFTTGGYICGEVKLAITLQLLAGGSYLDIAALYCSGYTYTYTIFHVTIRDWICNNRVISYPGLAYFEDVAKLRSESRKFQSCGSHGGIISGCIGALNGWLVKIRRPRSNDGAGHIASYFSRKGFYANNVQAIVNKEKLVIWRSIKCKGSEHDSTAFKKTTLHDKLLLRFRDLLAMGFYIVGDSAYAIRSFLLTPFDNALPNSAKDSFNYHHSTCRIWVECAFGEIDMRWGIFWKPLQFDLDKNLKVIDAAMRLHNYLVQNRDTAVSKIEEFQVYERETVDFMRENPFENVGLFNGHENEDRGHDGVGRSSRILEACSNEGKRLRQMGKEKFDQANKYMDAALELLQEGAQLVPMDVYMDLRKTRDHRGKFGKLFLRDVVRTIINKSTENADKLADDIITYLQHYATKPYSWSARCLKDVLKIISRCLEFLPDSARGSNQKLSETQVKEFIMEMIPDAWKEKVALHAAKELTDLSLDGLMSYLNTIEDLEKKAKEKKELQKKLEKRNAADQKAGGRKRTLSDRIPKRDGKKEFRDKSRQAQRQSNTEKLLCKLCYRANLPEKVFATHDDKDCKKFNADGSEKQSKKRKRGEFHNIEVDNGMEAAFKKAALDFSKSQRCTSLEVMQRLQSKLMTSQWTISKKKEKLRSTTTTNFQMTIPACEEQGRRSSL
ncbi:hypothetical protein CTEN210_17647 [Chaetoceros tenuissimus]|uniref:DDE Tnp4 domain-containing protein n=1 Tax=Chaetoceros tenuissimus TaxID=426638 RepID=A0AAD3HFA1_9STRA|nr:hypothetical protein CTEN210_17647 [Chaetoceros tenuissimus]